MFETVIGLKPESEWRPGMTVDLLIAEMDRALQFPGVSNAWTMPIKARIDMLSTGIRTPVGIKVFGPDLEGLEGVWPATSKPRCGRCPERPASTPNGSWAATTSTSNRTGRRSLATALMVGDMQEVIAHGARRRGGDDHGRGPRAVHRQRPLPAGVSLRSPGDRRERAGPHCRTAATVPLGQVASVRLAKGPPSMRTENAQLVVYIFVDFRDRDIGGYVAEAKQAVAEQVRFPPGYYVAWSGQFEYLQRAETRMKIVVPLTLLIIFLLLYLNFRRLSETLIVMLSLPFALDWRAVVRVVPGLTT